MIVFELNNCQVICPDDKTLDMHKVDNLTFLANKLEGLMPGTKACVDFRFSSVDIRLKDNPNKKMSLGFRDNEDYDSIIRLAVRIITKYNEMFNETEGESEK